MSEETITTIYVTKWCLTNGIKKYEIKGQVSKPTGFRIISGVVIKIDDEESPYRDRVIFLKNDFWLTKEDAVVDAERRRVNQIASHERSIKRLEALKFD